MDQNYQIIRQGSQTVDEKSQIIDEETTHIHIHSIQSNSNSQFITSFNTSIVNTETYDPLEHNQRPFNTRNSPTSSQNQFSTHFQNYPKYDQISQYSQNINQPDQNPSQIPPFQLDLQKFAHCLQSIEYSLTKIFYRAFQNKLISFYIHSLKEEQRKQRQTKQIEIKLLKQQNWPFKQLFYKKFRNQNQQIMFEFINMCAEKIQATFKGYLTFKRHKQAKAKIQNFKQKLAAITIGFKTWTIYNCKKVKQMRKTVADLSTQIDREIENPNVDRVKKMKKIEYLNSSQEVMKKNLHNSFSHLFVSGAWIYEVDKFFKKPLSRGKPTINMHSYQVQNESAAQIQSSVAVNQQPKQSFQSKPKTTRKRQFQGGLNRNAKKQTTPSKPILSNENQPIKAKGSYQIPNDQQGSGLEERPIVAKGKYELKEEDIENEFLKQNDNKKPNQTQHENQSPRINKFKDDEKKKLIKRQKYDPRKAIQQEKIRIQEERKKKIQAEKQALIEGNSGQPDQKKKAEKKMAQTNKKTPRIVKKELERRDAQSPKESSKEKTVEKVKSHLTKKNDNSKSIKLIVNNKKVESKVNCWGPKKDTSQTQLSTNEESSYKSKYLISLKEKNESKMTENSSYKQNDVSKRLNRDQKSISMTEDDYIGVREEAPKIVNKIQRRKTETDEEETFQSSYLKKLAEEKEKGTFSYGTGRIPGQRKFIEKHVPQSKEDSYAQKIEELNNNMKRLSQNRQSMTNLKNANQQQRKGSISMPPENQQKKKEEVHRSIEFLEDVYSGQYTDRYNTLKNKLNMLESTRYIQRDDTIPILLEDSKFIRKIYKDHTFSSLYWPQVRTMETNFLDYIKFSGF